MDYEILVGMVHKAMADTYSKLARCNDVYRLNKVLHDHIYTVGALADQAHDNVQELEELDARF